jgi:hypothetical protein
MGYRFAFAPSVPEGCSLRMGAATVYSWELPMDRSTTMLDMRGRVAEALSVVCDPRPEPEIWKALRKKRIESTQVDPEVIPGPVLKLLLSYFPDPDGLRFYRLTVINEALPGGLKNSYWMALPEDTTKHASVCSNPRWEERHRMKWVEIQDMTQEQLEAAVRDAILDTMRLYRDRLGGNYGVMGLTLVIEVFNWTALKYEDAIQITAKVLYRAFVQGEVRPCGRDHWKLAEE